MNIIFDLDGTLADISHRLHHVRDGNRNYDAFFADCVDDAPKHEVIATLQAHVAAGHDVQIWSGRSDAVRSQSEQWLQRHGITPSRLTRMRPDGDHRPDHELKQSWLLSYDRKIDPVLWRKHHKRGEV